MTPDLAPIDPARLAETLALAAGAATTAADASLCDVVLARLGTLVEATSGLVIGIDGARDTVVAAWRCAAPPAARSPSGPAPPLAAVAEEGAAIVWSVPLVARDGVVGRLELGRRDPREFAAADRAIIAVVAPRLALLVERERLVEAERAARHAAAVAAEALRTKEERFEAMCDGAFDFIGLTAPDGRLLEVNRAALEFVGMARGDVIGRPFWETPWWTHDPAQQVRLRATLQAAADGRIDGFEATHRARDGSLAVVDFAARPVTGADGAVRFVVVEGHDVTERRGRAEALTRDRDALSARLSQQEGELAAATTSLAETQALYRAVAETIVDGVVVIDPIGGIEWTNPAAAALFGYTQAEMIGRNVEMLMPPSDASRHRSYLAHYVATGERRIIGIGREVVGRRKDGSDFPMYLAVGETAVQNVRKFTGVVRDLSTTKRLEQQLQERQTLARIGELAAVVAHEVRNPLAAIRGVVEVIQTRFADDSPDRKVLGDLLLRVDSLDRLVSDLLVYAHPATPVFRPTTVLTLARSTADLLTRDRTVPSVTFEIGGDEAELEADPEQLSRALLNLMTNAAQAMRRGGVVRITGVIEAGRYRLRVEDEGAGMAAEVVEKCLEPFFTTKTRGTGLGLPIAKRVVEEHGGRFAVRSVEGHGTAVLIDLPLPDAKSADPM